MAGHGRGPGNGADDEGIEQGRDVNFEPGLAFFKDSHA